MKLDLEPIKASDNVGDMSQIYEANDLKIAMYRHKIDAEKDKILPNGFCYYCNAAVDGDRLFCPSEDDWSCATEYHKEEVAKKRNGRR